MMNKRPPTTAPENTPEPKVPRYWIFIVVRTEFVIAIYFQLHKEL
jgi:hypothetical protein